MKHIKFIILIAFTLSACGTYQLSKQQTDYYLVAETPNKDNDITAIIAPYKAALDEKMNEVVGNTTGELVKAKPSGSLNNFMADAIYDIAFETYGDTIDFAITNYGGIRIPTIAAGEITRGKLFELMPFENSLVVLELKGTVLEQWLAKIAYDGGWATTDHLSLGIDTLNNQHQYLLQEQPIDPNETYVVCTSDYIAKGGDQCDFLKDQTMIDLEVLLRDALIEYVSRTKVIEPDNRQRTYFIF